MLSIRNSRTRTPCYETVNGWAPLLFQQVGPLLYYFNGWDALFIISTGVAPSLLFQRVGLIFIISTGWAPSLLFQQLGGAPSLLFQRVGPFFIIPTGGPLLCYFNGWGIFYYFNGCMEPLLYYYFNGWGPFFIISRDALGAVHLFSPIVGYW